MMNEHNKIVVAPYEKDNPIPYLKDKCVHPYSAQRFINIMELISAYGYSAFVLTHKGHDNKTLLIYIKDKEQDGR